MGGEARPYDRVFVYTLFSGGQTICTTKLRMDRHKPGSHPSARYLPRRLKLCLPLPPLTRASHLPKNLPKLPPLPLPQNKNKRQNKNTHKHTKNCTEKPHHDKNTHSKQETNREISKRNNKNKQPKDRYFWGGGGGTT